MATAKRTEKAEVVQTKISPMMTLELTPMEALYLLGLLGATNNENCNQLSTGIFDRLVLLIGISII